MTEQEKMIAGEPYDPQDETLVRGRAWAKMMCEEYHCIPAEEKEARAEFIKGMFAKTGECLNIENNFWCDYGYNIEVGENFYVNHDCVFLDCAKITFGDNVFIAPQCGFYTAGHPLEADLRRKGIEYAKPITVGSDVWIGGGVKVMPGVTIGDNVVIGGGSVVVNDIPSNSLAVGNPAKVVRKL